MSALLRDLRFTVRSLLRDRSFALISIVTLSLGVGSTTAIFSVVNAVVLAPLPYPDAQELVRLDTRMVDGRLTGGALSPFAVTRLNEWSTTLESVTGAFRVDVPLQDSQDRPLKAATFVVTDGFFEVFAKSMALGRAFAPHEYADLTDPAALPQAVVLSHRLWQGAFNADPSIVGRSVPPSGMTVVGVAGPDFDFPVGADAWIAFRPPSNMTGFYLDAVGRLASGVAPSRARAELEAVSGRFAEEHSSFRARVLTMTDLKDSIVGESRTTLFVLLGAATTLLLIACANVMNLVLARGGSRIREIAMRSALGAGHLRLLAQLLNESLTLAGLGTLIGLGLTWVSLRTFQAVGPASLPRMSEIAIDGTVLAFAVGVTAGVAVLFGLLPALRLVGADLLVLWGGSARGAAGSAFGRRIFDGLVLAQTALAVTLVIALGLMVRSYGRLRAVDPGFDADSVLVMDANLPAALYPRYRDVARMYEELVNRVAEIPGVIAAGAASSVPMGEPLDFMMSTQVVGKPTSDEPERARFRQVTPGFFDAMGIEVLQGRALSPDDRIDAAGVVVVNEAFVSRLLGGDPPLGQQLAFGYGSFSDSTSALGYRRGYEYEIVGVVEDVRYEALGIESEPSLYFAHDQVPFRRMMVTAKVRGREATSISNDMRQAFAELDASLPVEFVTMRDLVDATLATDRLAMLLLLAFGASALVLAAVGIFGVISLSVARRTAEMAIRAALGAEPTTVLWISMSRGILFAGCGIAVGVLGAILARAVMATQLYEVSATDPAVMVLAPLALALVATIAGVLPALKATRMNLSTTLRTE